MPEIPNAFAWELGCSDGRAGRAFWLKILKPEYVADYQQGFAAGRRQALTDQLEQSQPLALARPLQTPAQSPQPTPATQPHNPSRQPAQSPQPDASAAPEHSSTTEAHDEAANQSQPEDATPAQQTTAQPDTPDAVKPYDQQPSWSKHEQQARAPLSPDQRVEKATPDDEPHE